MPQDWHDEPPPCVKKKPPARLLLVLTGLICAVLTTGTAASVYVAADASRRATGKRPALALLDLQAHRRGFAVHALIDTLLEPLGALPPMDSATLRGAVALLGQRSQPDAWITVDTGRLQSLDTLAFLRTWALHAPLPAFWGYRTMAWGGGWEKLPFRRLGAVKRFAQHNEELADSALLANDPLAAMNRAREIIAASRHLIDQPFAMDMLFGTYILQRGARLFARSAQQGDEPALASAAKRLDAIAGANYRLGIGERRALLNMGADPSGRSLLAIAGDTALPPGVRVEAPLEAMLRSACLNPREMMFGLSRARSDMFDEMLLALDDIARMREVAPSLRARLALFDAPAAFLENLKGARMKESLVSLLVPPVLRDRVKFCQLSG